VVINVSSGDNCFFAIFQFKSSEYLKNIHTTIFLYIILGQILPRQAVQNEFIAKRMNNFLCFDIVKVPFSTAKYLNSYSTSAQAIPNHP
jgi:hypothetical protein